MNPDILKELVDGVRQSITNPNIHGYRPHESQEQFHKDSAKGKLYIGGNRSGKTVGGCTEAVWRLRGIHPYRQDLPPPPIRGRACSLDLIDGLGKIMLPEFVRWIPPSDLINGSWEDSYNRSERTLTLTNGSFCEFLTYEQEKTKHAGTSRHFVWFDEEPPEEIFDENQLRLVDTAGDWWITVTPIHGMTYLYDRFYSPIMEDGVEIENVKIFQVSSYQNPHISRSIIESVTSGMSEADRQARLHGKFVAVSGLIYPEFDERLHTIDPIDPKKFRNNLVILAMDHGLRNPTAWLWFAIDSDGNVIQFNEHVAAEMAIEDHARIVHNFNIEHGLNIAYAIGDPAITQRTGINVNLQSVQQEYALHGIPIIGGNNQYNIGIDRVHWYLQNNRIRITKNCQHTIREFRGYRWATYASSKVARTKDQLEKPNKYKDHCMDAFRYFCCSRPENDTGSDPTPTTLNYMGVSHYSNIGAQTEEDYEPEDSKGSYHTILGDDW